MNKDMLEFRKKFNDMQKKINLEANIKECFHPNKAECKGGIIKAHSLQRQGALKTLEKEVKGNKYLYVHTEREHNFKHDFFDLKKVGRKAATTFDGFCSFHDTELFKEIENDIEATDICNDKHMFLHSYRSFSVAYHRKFEEMKLYNSKDEEVLSFFKEAYSNGHLEAIKEGVSMALNDLKPPKEKLDEMLVNEDYSSLRYFAFEYDYTVPVACASYITPHNLPNGKMIQMNSYSENQSSIITTVLPFENRTIVVLAVFMDDEVGMQYIDELELLFDDEMKFNKFMSFYLLTGAENLVVSPHYIDTRSVKFRKEYCSFLNYVANPTTPFVKYNQRKFPLNYFSKTSAIN